MRVISLDAAGYAANSYLIVCDSKKEFAVVDPSVDIAPAKPLFDEGYTLRYVLLTHGHFDHILFIDEWRARGGKVCIHRRDAEFLGDPTKSLYLQFFSLDKTHADADILLSDGDKLALGDGEISVMSTPGHTGGSVCYLFEQTMMSGDTLFYGSIGRTDLYGSDEREMQESIEKLSQIQTDYTVYPGHGGKTTLEREKRYGYLHH